MSFCHQAMASSVQCPLSVIDVSTQLRAAVSGAQGQMPLTLDGEGAQWLSEGHGEAFISEYL